MNEWNNKSMFLSLSKQFLKTQKVERKRIEREGTRSDKGTSHMTGSPQDRQLSSQNLLVGAGRARTQRVEKMLAGIGDFL